jgi:NADH-quinone oxidoreductase subunit E
MDTTKVAEIIERHQSEPRAIIAMLQDIQDEYRHIPRDALNELSDRLGIPKSRAYALATFFKAFTLKPRGEHHICVCVGTACHVQGGQRIMERLERELGIRMGETTEDQKFSLEAVRCVGCCGLAPVVVVGDDLHGKVRQDQLQRLLKKYGKTGKGNGGGNGSG